MKIYIRNMVCIRCKMIVKQELKKLSLHFVRVDLGEIDILESISPQVLILLDINLKKYGLEVLDDKKENELASMYNYNLIFPLNRWRN